MQSKATVIATLHPLEWFQLKMEVTSVDKDMGKLECLHTADGSVKWCVRGGNRLGSSAIS